MGTSKKPKSTINIKSLTQTKILIGIDKSKANDTSFVNERNTWGKMK